MALDKSRTPGWVRVVIIVVVCAFVLSTVTLASGGFSGLFGSSGDSADASGQLETAAQDYAPTIASLDQALASDPTSATLLVNVGNQYFDWAVAAQSAQAAIGADLPMWVSAARYYELALAEKGTDPPVQTDLAIAYFYMGQRERAIGTVEAVLAKSPDFGPAYFNAAVFYKDAGQSSDAVRVLQEYLKLEPAGAYADSAKQILAELGSSPSAIATP